MEHSSELSRALAELSRVTGVSMDIQVNSQDDMDETIRQIRCLCTAYKEKYNKNYFLLNLMTSSDQDYDIHERATRLHIHPDKPRVLFLLETKSHMEDAVSEILKQVFPFQEKVYLVPVNEYQLAVLCPVKGNSNQEDIHQTAHMIIDTLSAEALVRVQLAYSNIFDSITDLAEAYKQVRLALKVGKLFYSEQTIFPYNHLGVGRLVYQLPKNLCEDFLLEVIGDTTPEPFDKETLTAVDKFFQNNLNIAETSRQLHMHRNTLIYRLEQIEKKTGLDLRQFEDALTFKIAIMIMNYLQSERNV